jgi:hypothetical protein
MAALSVSVLVCIKHNDRAERERMIDERERERYMATDYYMRGHFHLWVHHSGRLVLAIHIFSLRVYFSDVIMRVLLFVASLLFITPLFRDLVF